MGADHDITTTMQRRGAGGRFDYGGAVAYELSGVHRMNEELERKAFEEWIADFLGQTLRYIQGQRSTTGRYYNEYIDIPWQVWQARAKQERNHDS